MSLSLEKRVAALEKEMAVMRRHSATKPAGREWVDDLYGKFAGDPLFAHAMKLGTKYRQSLRPNSRNGKTKR